MKITYVRNDKTTDRIVTDIVILPKAIIKLPPIIGFSEIEDSHYKISWDYAAHQDF